jgi:hypothetical protein
MPNYPELEAARDGRRLSLQGPKRRLSTKHKLAIRCEWLKYRNSSRRVTSARNGVTRKSLPRRHFAASGAPGSI